MSEVTTDVPVAPTEAASSGPEVPDGAVYRSYGVGMGIDAIKANPEANAAFELFRDKQVELKLAEAEHERLKAERNEMIRTLKDDHNIGFSAMAEITETSSSNVLYLYERSKGLTAKEIKALSRASNATREQLRADSPPKGPTRKQSPVEKAFRKRQREELRAFMTEERARLEAEGGDTSEMDAGLAGLTAEDAADANDDT